MKKKKKHHAVQGKILNLHPVRQTSAIQSQEATSGKTKQNQVLQRWGIMTTSLFLLSLIRKSTVLHFPQTYIYLDINKILSQFQLPHHFTSAIGAKISIRFQIPIEKKKKNPQNSELSNLVTRLRSQGRVWEGEGDKVRMQQMQEEHEQPTSWPQTYLCSYVPYVCMYFGYE
jgi:hypothetical protein